jgi:tetratricopeptide (TPR) repeat protein
MRGLMGTFAVLPLPDLLELLGRRQLVGALTCERGTVRKTLFLTAGVAVGAASNDPREYLGQLLINFGHINEEQLQKAFQTQEETKIRLGRVLTMVGLITPATVKEVLAIKIRETILDVFLWDSGLFYFEDTPPGAIDESDAAVPLADIVKEAEFRATAWNAFRGEFPGGASALVVDEGRVPDTLGPSTVDGRLLQAARDGKTIDEIGLALHATDFHLYQRLYSLARQGILRAAPERGGVAAAIDEAVEGADLLERARALLAEGRPGEAEELAARAVEVAPASEPARALLAQAEAALGERLRAELIEVVRVPVLRVKPGDIQALRLSSSDKYLLSRCDGRRSVRQLVQIAPLKELEVLKALRRFTEDQVVRLEAGAA